MVLGLVCCNIELHSPFGGRECSRTQPKQILGPSTTILSDNLIQHTKVTIIPENIS